MEYYLLYYDLERNERTGDESPDLIYAVCLGDISDETAEFFACEYVTTLGNQTGIIREYAPSVEAGNEPLYVIRPSLSFDESMKFLCARAAARFDMDSRSNPLGDSVAFMQKIAQTAKEYKDRFPLPSPNEVCPDKAVANLEEETAEGMNDEHSPAISISTPPGPPANDERRDTVQGHDGIVKPQRKKARTSLEDLAKTLSFPRDECESDDWVLAENVEGAKTSTLRTRRSDGEKIRAADKSIPCDESVLGRDPQGRVWWKPEESSQKVFYYRKTLSQPVTCPAKKSSKTTRNK